jgi:hypothetical protein
MTEQQLDGPHVGAVLEQMDREGVAQGMRRDGFGDACGSMRFPAHQLDSVSGNVPARDIAREEPWLGFF